MVLCHLKNGGEHHPPSVGDERTGVPEHPRGKPRPGPVPLHAAAPQTSQRHTGEDGAVLNTLFD